MKIEYHQTSYDRFGKGSGGGTGKRRDGGLFWWTMLITVLTGLCCFSWFYSIYVFSHPEKPFNYNLLVKLDKLEPVERFTTLNAPAGAAGFLSPKAAYARFAPGPGRMGKAQLQVTNNILKRNYLLNYKEEKPLYVTAQLRIDQIRRLGPGDPIETGLVLRGAALDYTALDLEYIIPTTTPVEAAPFKVGDVVEITGPNHYASVVHVDHLPEERVALSLISLTYPRLRGKVSADEEATPAQVAQSPPDRLNISGEWPLTAEGRGDGMAGGGDKAQPDEGVEGGKEVATVK